MACAMGLAASIVRMEPSVKRMSALAIGGGAGSSVGLEDGGAAVGLWRAGSVDDEAKLQAARDATKIQMMNSRERIITFSFQPRGVAWKYYSTSARKFKALDTQP